MASDTARAMLDLLLREAGALRRGDFPALARIADEKAACLDDWVQAAGTLPRKTLDQLRAQAAANARLIEAARSGIIAARDRVAAMNRTRATLDTYAPDGSLRSVPGTLARHERRA